MNKLIITIISLLLLTATDTLLAQNSNAEPAKNAQRHHRGMQNMPIADQMMRAIKQLELDDEQEAGIKAVTQALKADIRPIMMKSKAGHEQLKALIKADTFDEGAVTALAEKEGNLAAERVLVTSRAMSSIYSQLTDEQRNELNSMATSREQKRAEKREQKPDEG